jgi:cysteine desulfurase/selenocysteine lyase
MKKDFPFEFDNPDLECMSRSRLEEDFPILSREVADNRLIYLDNAATTLKPKQVVSEISRYYLEISANIHRGKHYLSDGEIFRASGYLYNNRQDLIDFFQAPDELKRVVW